MARKLTRSEKGRLAEAVITIRVLGGLRDGEGLLANEMLADVLRDRLTEQEWVGVNALLTRRA